MIEKIRKPKKSRSTLNYIVYAVIFGMIIATFVFMIPGLGGGGGAVNSAAEVGSTTISLRDYNDQLRITRSQYQKMFNGEIPPFFENSLKAQVLDSLVRQEVLKQYAVKNDLLISDVEVADVLKRDIEAFQEDGQFSFSRYNSYLKGTRTTASKFENKIYKDLISRRLYKTFDSSLKPSGLEKKLAEKAAQTNVDYKIAKLEDSEIEKNLKLSDSEVQSFVNAEQAVSELKSFYESQKENYKSPASVLMSYLLVKDEAKAQSIRKTLSPDTFAAVATAESEDPVSKAKGGDLGWVEQGSFAPNIEGQAFALGKNEISSVFKTPQGYAVVYVRDKKAASYQDFESIKAKLAKDFLRSKGVSSFKDNIAKALQAKSEPQVTELMNKANIKWSDVQTYSLSSDELQGVGASEDIIAKMLSLKDGEVYKNILSFSGSDYLVKKLSVKKSSKTAQVNTASRGGALLNLVYQNEKKALKVQENAKLLSR